MALKMDSHGNWINTSDGESKTSTSSSASKSTDKPKAESSNKTVTDKGNTSETKESIKDSTDNKTTEIKYAEEANFTCVGDCKIRKGCYLNVRRGVADRWTGKWLILETTHTIDIRGYKVDGVLGKIPYKETTQKSNSPKKSSSGSNKKAKVETSNKKTASDSSSSKTVSNKTSKAASSYTKKKMLPDGTWVDA